MPCGNYVSTFARASHAIPDGMHMNADYPFMLPKIVRVTDTSVVLQGRNGEGEAKIGKYRGRWCCCLDQSSSYESIYNLPPKRWRFFPFKDKRTPAVGDATTLFGGTPR